MRDYFFSNVQSADLYATHCLVKDMFPVDEKLLWARSTNGVLVRSKQAPVAKGATYIEREIPAITAGGNYSFCLNANAVIQRQCKQGDGSMKKVNHQIRDWQEDSLKVWLLNRSFSNGFAIKSLKIDAHREVINRKEQTWDINYTEFAGELIVVDEDKFTNAVNRGIGRAKAFGAGLLIIS